MAMARDGKEDPSLTIWTAKEQVGFWQPPDRSRGDQNGFTITRMTMRIISTVGISLTILQ